MRKKVLAANWKMNKSGGETVSYFNELKQKLPANLSVDIIIAPPFTALKVASECIQGTSLHLAAQNMHWEIEGAYTGEISVSMLKELQCEYVILGHSERRKFFLETDERINRKIKTALTHHLKVIFCVGETLIERRQHETLSILKGQMRFGLDGVSKEKLRGVIIAYEPVWAIGTGEVASLAQIEEAHQHIRKMVWESYGMDAASWVSVLYGGSVTPDNFSDIALQPNVDGALVGGASLNANSFIEILKQMK